MGKITPTIAITLVAGVALGYLLRGNSPAPQPQSQEKSMTENAPQKDSKEWKIQNAKSAAPDAISKDATVMDWPEKDGAAMPTLQKGTNEWTCLPDWPVSPGNDPMCVDKMAMQWFGAYMSKKKPQIDQAGLGYMLQGSSDPSNTDPYADKPAPGEDWTSSPPHIMIFPTGKLDKNVYGTDNKNGKPWIMWAGTPYEHLMIPVK
ncbi:hypothetical protein HY029_00135 [Candidatus Gottesmanbacteria bacterium]|nr:hypothetical protein [Candidatus Gottesmanbacteria bacterium]